MALYDFIYIDRSKVSSLYSQLTGGIVEVRESVSEHGKNADNKRSYDFKVFKHDAGGTSQEKSGEKEVIKPHHALILELEDELRNQGYLLDLTNFGGSGSLRDAPVRAMLKRVLCVKVRGRAAIEDYTRLQTTASAFPEVSALINKSVESNIKGSAEYRVLEEQLASRQNEIRQTKDSKLRAQMTAQLGEARRSLDALIQGARIGNVDQWIIDGFKTWVDTFLPGITNFRIYPRDAPLDEHVFGHLKRDCLEDPDTYSLHFTYGSLPTEELTLLGVVTSVPEAGEESFRPLAEFDKESLRDFETVEKAFRGLFRGFDGLEAMVRTSRFPRVLVQPLTIYREVVPIQTLAARQ